MNEFAEEDGTVNHKNRSSHFSSSSGQHSQDAVFLELLASSLLLIQGFLETLHPQGLPGAVFPARQHHH